MNGVSQPPSRSSQPPDRKRHEDPSQDKKTKKDFNLPRKGKKQDEKRQSLLDMVGGEVKQEIAQQSKEQQATAEAKESSAIQGAQAKAAVVMIGKLLQNTVEQMHIGKINSQNIINMELSASSKELPGAFAGSNLLMSHEAGALTVQFSQFMTPDQERRAIQLVENNKEQLVELVQALQARNLHIQKLTIGDHEIVLPQAAELPSSLQSIRAGTTELRQDQQGQQRDDQEDTSPE